MKQNIVTTAVILTALFFACDSGDKSSPEDPKGNIQISSTPAGAAIYLDNVHTGQVTPFTIDDLDTGFHEIRLSKSGYFDDSAMVRVEDGSTAMPSFTLTLLSAPVGRIFLESAPAGAAIFLDGNPTGKITPDTLTTVTVGDHNIKLTLTNYVDSVFSVTVSENVTTSRSVTMREAPFGNTFMSSTPAGAAIFVDAVNTTKVTPDTVKNLSTGDHTVKLTLAGYFDTTFTVTVPNANQTVSQSIALAVLPFGNLFISSTPTSAAIFVDGVNSSKVTPDTLKNLSSADHTIKLVLAGYFDSTFTVTIPNADQTVNYATAMRLKKVPVVIQNIFNAHCISCHSGSTPPQGQNLSDSLAYLNIVDVASHQQPAIKRIAPGDTTNSYLIMKIQGSPGISGLRMPRNGPPYLTTAQIDSIRSWVFNGALPR